MTRLRSTRAISFQSGERGWVEILKRPSDDQTKFDLFQRLNAGGTQANAQELRNCIILMINGQYYRAVKRAAEQVPFQTVLSVTEEQIERQRHMEYAVRFLVHTYVPYNGTLDVEEYIDEGISQLAGANNGGAAEEMINQTFTLLNNVAGGTRCDGSRTDASLVRLAS